MTAAVHTPLTTDLATNTGRIWRKQVLPIGSINYKGRRLDFTRDYLNSLVDAFKAKAYDSVKFLLAPDDNSHTLDPERARGTVKGFELTNDGLDMLLEPTPDGEKVLTDHPDLGVSVRIVEQLERADGKTFPRAIQHVLGTLDPRVTGMRPWQAVNLAVEDTAVTVVDLTAAEWNHKEEGGMADLTAEQQARLARLLDLPDEQFTALLTAPATPAADSTTTTDGDADGLSDDELNQLLADLENDETVTDGQLVDATLSADQQAAIDLANAQNVELQQRLRVLESQAATDQWNAYATSLVSQGVPPADINLARSALLPDQAIDLSNSDSIRGRLDAMTNTIRQLLEARKGTVDLSHARGTGIDPGEPDPASGDDYWFPQFTTPTSRQEA